jgi:hypothetical protein
MVSKELKERSTHITSAKSCAAYGCAANGWIPANTGLSPALLSELEHGKLLSHSFAGCAGIQRGPGIFFCDEAPGHRQAGV